MVHSVRRLLPRSSGFAISDDEDESACRRRRPSQAPPPPAVPRRSRSTRPAGVPHLHRDDRPLADSGGAWLTGQVGRAGYPAGGSPTCACLASRHPSGTLAIRETGAGPGPTPAVTSGVPRVSGDEIRGDLQPDREGTADQCGALSARRPGCQADTRAYLRQLAQTPGDTPAPWRPVRSRITGHVSSYEYMPHSMEQPRPTYVGRHPNPIAREKTGHTAGRVLLVTKSGSSRSTPPTNTSCISPSRHCQPCRHLKNPLTSGKRDLSDVALTIRRVRRQIECRHSDNGSRLFPHSDSRSFPGRASHNVFDDAVSLTPRISPAAGVHHLSARLEAR